MRKAWPYVVGLLTLLVVSGTVWFFVHAFQQHLEEIRQAQLAFRPLPLGAGVGLLLLAYGLITQAWRVTLTTLAQRPLSFGASVSALHLPGLTKYLPGRVWSYALQMLWLTRQHFAPEVVLYANLVNVLTSLAVSAWLGLALLLWQARLGPSQPVPAAYLGAMGLVSLLASAAFVWCHRPVMARLKTLLQRLSGRAFTLLEAPPSLLLRLQAYYAMIYTCFGLASFALAAGMGLPLGFEALPGIIAAVTIADALGFMVLLTPGGLGVRESVMALLLSGVTDPTLALLLPMVSRVASMSVEALLGGGSMLLVSRVRQRERARAGDVATPPASHPLLEV